MSEPGDEEAGESTVPAVRARGMRGQVLRQQGKVQGGQVAVKPKRRKTNAQSRLLAMEKQRQALELRKGGATYEQIAKAVGYNDASAARKSVEKAISQTIQEPAVELKTLNIERLNHMLLTLWPKVQQGDERAIDTSLRVMDKIDRLMGTEAAQQVDINVNQQSAILVIDGSKEDYLRSLRQMAGIAGDGTNVAASMDAMGPAAAPPTGVIEGEVVSPCSPSLGEPCGNCHRCSLPAFPDDGTSLADHLSQEQRDAIHSVMRPPDADTASHNMQEETSASDSASAPEQPKRKFNFGVEPTREGR